MLLFNISQLYHIGPVAHYRRLPRQKLDQCPLYYVPRVNLILRVFRVKSACKRSSGHLLAARSLGCVCVRRM